MSESARRKPTDESVNVFQTLNPKYPPDPSCRSLLISLAIFRALATECRRDIALLSPSLIASVDATLSAVPSDLEVVARAASVVC